MKRLLAGAITAGMIGLFLWSGPRDSAPGPTGPGAITPVPEPSAPLAAAQARLRELLETGRRGDVEGYLAAFAGSLRERLEREVNDRGRDGFAADLRRAGAARKSHAVFAAEPDGPDACRIVVEAVYPDRNERQTYRLKQTPAGWRIAAVDSVRSHSPEETYGSPAGFAVSQGPPAPAAGPE